MRRAIITHSLPKKYQKRWADEWDRDFLFILGISFLIHTITIFYFLANPLPSSQLISRATLENVQGRYARVRLATADSLVKGNLLSVANIPEGRLQMPKPLVTTESRPSGEPPVRDTTPPVTDEDAREEQQVSQTQRRDSQPDFRRRLNTDRERQVNSEVAREGILGVLTSKNGQATPDELHDILEEGELSQQEYSEKLEQLDRLRTKPSDPTDPGADGTSGTGRSKARGNRRTEGGKIDQVVTRLGTAQSSDLKRESDFDLLDLAPLASDGPNNNAVNVNLGGRDINNVSSIVYAHSAAIQYCYERELDRRPNLKGKVAIRFTIRPNGRVVDPEIISSTLDSKSVERCILSRVSRWDDFGSIDPELGDASFRQVYTFGF